MKRLLSFILLLNVSITKCTFSQEYSESAPKINTFILNADIKGMIGNSVNLFNGDLALPLNLISLPGRNGLDASVSIAYSSNIHHLIDTWNLTSPTGILGLGWSFDYDKIVVDNKNTGSRHDDEFYLISGGSSNPLIRVGTSGNKLTYELKNYQFWKITCDTTDEKWEIIKEDGNTYTYGGVLTSDANGKHSLGESVQWAVKWSNWIGNSVVTSGQQQYGLIWNLSSISNNWKDSIYFQYQQDKNQVGTGGKYHTEASYLYRIVDTYKRYAQFNYAQKDAALEYKEPHTEKAAEPDAYQERYEKKYLSNIEMYNESNVKLLSVEFSYSYVNVGYADLVKRVLTAVTQKNASGEALPSMKFEYRSSNPNKHALEKITFPMGSSVMYTYTDSLITLSNREFTIDRPSGYSQPRFWITDDYVVVSWRNGNDSIKVFAYYWDGQWVSSGQLLQIGRIDRDDDLQDFEILTEKDFFCLIADVHDKDTVNGIVPVQQMIKRTYLFRKSTRNSSDWTVSTFYSDIENHFDNNCHFFSGRDFVGILGAESGELIQYRWNGTSWTQSITDDSYSGVLHRFWASPGGVNNFITLNQLGSSTDVIKWYYLDELGNWQISTLNSSLSFNTDGGGDEPTYFYPSSTFTSIMPHGETKRIIRWDENFNGLDSYSIQDGSNTGPILIGNSLVTYINNTANGRPTMRFNASSWSRRDTTSNSNNYSFAVGEDYTAFSINNIGGSSQYNWFDFDPNTNQFVLSTRSISGNNSSIVSAGNGYFIARPWQGAIGKFHMVMRRTDGYWYSFERPCGDYMEALRTAYNFFTYNGLSGHAKFMPIINDSIPANPISISNQTMNPVEDPNIKYQIPQYQGNYTFITIDQTKRLYEADKIYLHRVVNNTYTGALKDYPVSKMNITTGNITADGQPEILITEYQYNRATASYDQSATVVQYNEVTVIPKVKILVEDELPPIEIEAALDGYTKTYFVNGLMDTNFSAAYTDQTMRDNRGLLKGTPYYSAIYDAAGNLKSYSRSSLSVYTKQLGQKEQGTYIRPTLQTSYKDGVTSQVDYTYSTTTGLVTLTHTTNHDASGNTDNIYQYNKYWYEAYDASNTKNMLTPVIQSKIQVNSTITSVSATTWKDWGSGKWAPNKTYTWKGTGSSDFNFSLYSGGTEPPSDWLKTSEVVSRLSTGGVKQSRNIDGLTSSAIYDYQYQAPIASFGNARISDATLGSEASFLNFESFNETSGIKENDYWTFISSNDFSTDAHSGVYSRKVLQGSLVYEAIRDFLPPDLSGQRRKYIISCWVKTQPGFGANKGTLVMYSKRNSDSDNSTYPNVAGASAGINFGDTGGQWKYIEAVVDLAQVRTTGGISDAELLRLRCWVRNTDASKYFLVDDIRFSPYDSPFSATVYEKKYGLPVASLGSSGEISRKVFDNYQRGIGTVLNEQVVNGIGASYFSRKGNNDLFDNRDPNSNVSISSKGSGKLDDFNDYDVAGWSFNTGNWTVVNGELQHTGVGQSDLATFLASSGSQHGMRVKVKYFSGYDDFGIMAGNLLVRRYNPGSGAIWQMSNEGITDNFTAPMATDWLLIISDKTAFFYADGRLIFEKTYANIISGSFKLYTGEPNITVSFDDVLYFKEPSIAMAYMDGTGKKIQSQLFDGTGTVVTESLFDGVGRGAVSTKSAKYTDSLFVFRHSFVTGYDWSTGELEGYVVTKNNNDAYSYARDKYENSPQSRVIEASAPGQTFSLGQHTPRTIYGKNIAGDGLRDDLPANQYFQQIMIDANYDTSWVITDKSGNTVTKRSGPVFGPGLLLDTTLSVEFGGGMEEIAPQEGKGGGVSEPMENMTTVLTSSTSFTPGFTQTASYSCWLFGGSSYVPPKTTYYTAYFKIGTSPGGSNVVSHSKSGSPQSFNGTFAAQAGITYYIEVSGNATYSEATGSVNFDYYGEGMHYVQTSYVYDDFGRLTTIYLPNYYNPPTTSTGTSFVVTMQYDFLGRLTQKTTPDAGTTKFMYDKTGRLRFTMDANGDAQTPDNISYFKYDTYGRKIEEGYYSYNWSSITQANADDPAWPTTPATWRKKYYFDGDTSMAYMKGRLQKVETNNDTDSPFEVEETYQYDIYGRMPSKTTKVVDYDNYLYTTFYEYDYSGNVTKIYYPYNSGGGGQMAMQSGLGESENLVIQDMTFDDGSNKVIESEGDIVFTGEFNSNGADVIAKPGVSKKPVENAATAKHDASQSQLLLDGGGGMSAMSSPDPNATVVTYTYNTLGQLISIGNATDLDYFVAYSYNPDGSMATEKMKDTTIKRYFSYESQGWLKSITDSYFADTLCYTSDGYGGAGYYNGNISKMIIDYKFSGAPADYSYRFKYDKLSQLLVADHSANSAGDMGVGTGNENKFDANGNFIRVVANTTTKNYNYYANTNKVQNTDGSGNDYVYDNIGNITSSSPKTISTLTYDPFINRTRNISMGSGAGMSFEYDGTERRVYAVETPANSKVLYLHDGMNSIQERSSSGTATEYVYGPTGIIALKTSTTWKFMIKDHLGSTRAVVDGSTVTGYDYSAFGTILGSVSSSGYYYTGQEYDKTSGLNNFKARMYDSDLGRFYAGDPAGEFPYNYGYAGNNPLSYRDPSGKFIQFVIMGALMSGYMGGVQADIQGKSVWKGIGKGAFIGAVSGATGAGASAGLASMGIGGAIGGGVSGALSGGVGSALSGSNVGKGMLYGGVIGFAMGALQAHGDLQSQANDIGKDNNPTTQLEGDQKFIDDSMESLKIHGGEPGQRQYNEITGHNTEVVVDNNLQGQYGQSYKTPKTLKDWFSHYLTGNADYNYKIALNRQRLLNPPTGPGAANDHSGDWAAIGLKGPENVIGRASQTLFHESGHLFGLYYNNTYYTPAELDHGLSFYRKPFFGKLGGMTKDWLEHYYVPNFNPTKLPR
ncbi:RHS repeat-associated core domain-containing protein [bacterium]|nr:MAG: RHS repeat-associated core domain-containing protein [bacterium]